MLWSRLLISIASIFILISSCNDKQDSPDPIKENIEQNVRELTSDESKIAATTNTFTFDLMSRIESAYPNDNYFISSFSVSTALSMLMNGASANSQNAFIQTIGLSGMSATSINESYKTLVDYIYNLDQSVTLNVANSNWYTEEYTIKSQFANSLDDYYNAEIYAKNFDDPATLTEINSWVENETNGKIKDILDNIDPEHVMFLINAIYFKANWTTQFDSDKTKDLPFYLSNGQTIQVPTMYAEAKHWLSYDDSLKAQLIEIPYGNKNYSFTIIMPDEASEINGLASKIDADQLNKLLDESTEFERDLYLPKFQLDFKHDLKSILNEMGMPIDGLDNLFEEPLPLEISQVIHQSFLEVNEEGSEAAAATVIGVGTTSIPPTTQINKPFLFLIRERNSGTILFSGRLLDPR